MLTLTATSVGAAPVDPVPEASVPVAAIREVGVEGVEHPAGHGRGLLGAGDVLAEHGVLVAAHPGQGVARAQEAGQALGHGHQQPVAALVAEAVVDHLEAVDVEDEEGDGGPVAQGAGQRVLQPVPEQDPVGQVGEAVVEGLAGELDLEPAPLADVADEAVDHPPLVVLGAPDGDLHRELGARPVDCGQLPLGDRRPVGAGQRPPEAVVVGGPVADGDHDLAQAPAEDLAPEPAEHRLRPGVPLEDGAEGVEADEGVVGGLDEAPAVVLGGGGPAPVDHPSQLLGRGHRGEHEVGGRGGGPLAQQVEEGDHLAPGEHGHADGGGQAGLGRRLTDVVARLRAAAGEDPPGEAAGGPGGDADGLGHLAQDPVALGVGQVPGGGGDEGPGAAGEKEVADGPARQPAQVGQDDRSRLLEGGGGGGHRRRPQDHVDRLGVGRLRVGRLRIGIVGRGRRTHGPRMPDSHALAAKLGQSRGVRSRSGGGMSGSFHWMKPLSKTSW